MEPARGSERAWKPELKDRAGIVWNPQLLRSLLKGRNCPADHKTKRTGKLRPTAPVQKWALVTRFDRVMKGCERNGCYMLNAKCV